MDFWYLALAILRRDRRREDRRQASADTFTIDADVPGFFTAHRDKKIRISVHDSSDAPISFVYVRYRPFPDILEPITLDNETTPYIGTDFANDGLHHIALQQRLIGAEPLGGKQDRTYKMIVPYQYRFEDILSAGELYFMDITNIHWTVYLSR